MAKINVKSVFYDKLRALKPVRALQKAIIKNADAISDLNRQQLDKGLDSEGKSLGKYARFNYKGRWQPVDLKLKGPFRREFYVEPDEKKTEIKSTDWKESILIKMYGRNIHGVPKYLIPNMGHIVLADFINEFKKQL